MSLPILALMILLTSVSVATAGQQRYFAGFIRVTVQDAEPFDATIWYPTNAAEAPVKAGPYVFSVARDAGIAGGARFPVLLLSHGRRGSPLGHRDLAAHLARDGFVVIAPTHVGDAAGQPQAPPRPQRQILADRPRQARLALDRILGDPRFSQSIDATRVGAIGFSAGGYTVLALAGARPNLAQAVAYCRDHAEDRGSCGAAAAPRDTSAATPSMGVTEDPPMPNPRLNAIVVMDPLAILFDAAGLSSLRMPMLLLRPESDDYLSAKGNALALATALPVPPQQMVVPGSHFVFIDPCPAELAEMAPALCKDAPGVDRATVHRQIESAISEFLRENL